MIKNLTDFMVEVANVSKEIGSLSKGPRNTHHKYSYVSIDSYYEDVASVANQKGIHWFLMEAHPAQPTPDGKVWIFSYRIKALVGGELIEVDHITIPHPWQGAQTSAAARSYADKTFMRTLFKIPTGEPDSDDLNDRASEQPVVGQAPAGEVPTVALADLEGFLGIAQPTEFNPDDLRRMAVKCQTPQDLQSLWAQNEVSLNTLRKNHPEIHQKLSATFMEAEKRMTK